jgi:hypothetical protein
VRSGLIADAEATATFRGTLLGVRALYYRTESSLRSA